MTDSVDVAPTPTLAGLVARNVATLGAGELLSRLIGFVATVYIARRLGVEEYGIIGFGFAILLYATALVDGGLEHTGPREVAERRDQLAELTSSLLIARIIWALVVAGLLGGVALLFFSGVERMVLGLFALALLPVGASTRWLHLGLERSGLVAAARVLAELVRVVAILTLVRGPADLRVVPLAQLAGDTLAAALLLGGMRAAGIRLRYHFDAVLTRGVFKRAAPMAASALLALMIYNADLVFLRIFRDPADVGLYLAGYTLINFLGILGHVVALTLVPAFTRLRATPLMLTSLYNDAFARVFAAGLPIAVGGYLVAPLLIDLVFGDSYAASAPVLAILIWSMPVVLLRSVLQAALISDGRADMVLRTTLAAAVSNVALNAIAVPLLGMYGAALTTVVAETVRMVAALIYARRAGFPAAPVFRFARSAIAAAAMAAALLVIRPSNLWVALALGVSSYVLTLFAAGGLRIRRNKLLVTV